MFLNVFITLLFADIENLVVCKEVRIERKLSVNYET
jgi:hypothetical protein